MESCELTILMPCLNEAETLARCIQKAKTYLTESNIQGEILIVDNGSHDGSQQIAIENGARVLHVATKGYGAALKGGITDARGKYIIMGDADDSYNFLNLDAFVHQLRAGHDLVMGNRFKGGILDGAMPFLNRYLGNPVLSFIGRTFFKNKIGDFHCGLRGFVRDRFLSLDLQGDGMEFASEMVVKASLKKFKITEVPTALHPDGRNRAPHLRPWRDGWRHLRLLLLFSPTWLFFYPGLLLFLTGFTAMFLLYRGPFIIHHLHFDIHTMLIASLFLLTGFEAICFSFFARTLAEKQLHLEPSNSPFNKISRYLSLEIGLLFGVSLMLFGMMGAIYTFFLWRQSGFGELSPEHMMRILIPASTAFMIGIQSIFSSFFMALLSTFVKK